MRIGGQSFLHEVIFGPRARFGEFRDQQKTKNAISLGQTSPILIVRNRSREANTSTIDLAFIMFPHGNSNQNVQLRVGATMEASVAENLHTRLIFPVIAGTNGPGWSSQDSQYQYGHPVLRPYCQFF